MIDTIQIKGFKSVYKTTISLGRLNVFIGANGAGKSAVLEAIGVLGAAADGHVDDAALLRRGVRPGVPKLYKSAFSDTPVPPLIALQASSGAEDPATYSLSLDNPIGEVSAAWRFSHEKVSMGTQKVVSRSPNGARLWSADGDHRRFTAPDATRSVARTPSPFGPIPSRVTVLLDTLRDFTIFDPHTPVLRGTETDMWQRDPIGVHGGRLAEAVNLLLKDGKHFGEIPLSELTEMLVWVSEIRSIAPTPDLISPSIPIATEVVRFTDRFLKKGRNTLSAYDASEGALYVLFAFTLLFHPRAPLFLAIENIDHALHPRLARALVRAMADHIGKTQRQMLLTTHNPLVLDALDLADESIRLFTVDRTSTGHTEVRRIQAGPTSAAMKRTNLALSQLWTRGLIGAVPNLS